MFRFISGSGINNVDMALFLFNTNIIPGEAVVRVREITPSEAAKLAANGFVSAIGHESTAAAFGEIIGQDVPVNRIQAAPVDGDTAVSLKLNGRLPEGQILDRAQLDEIGYTLYRIDFYDATKYCVAHENQVFGQGSVG